jgi:hypothetical protein
VKLGYWGFAMLGVAALAAAELDLSDFDTLLMQDMDATVKDLEPLIGGRNAPAATDAVAFLEEGLDWTESYFAAKGVPDAEKIAREGKERAVAARAAIAGGDFNAAAAAARELAKSCRACHDAYRP